MQRELQHQLVRRVLAHLEHRTTDHDDHATSQPVSAYLDPVRHDRERVALFRRVPLLVGRASQLASPGDFFTHDASGVPLLIVRDDAGTIRAFLNVCRHRGTRVEAAPCGAKKAFVCPYHAWTYGRDGALLSIAHPSGFAGFERRGLVEVPCAEIAGFIAVAPSPDAPPIDRTWLGPLADELLGFMPASSHVYAPTVMSKAMSWKLAIDVFLESYHLRPTHKQTIYPLFFDNLGLVDRVGPHLRNVFPKRSIRELANLPSDTWELRRRANVLYHLFPNTLVLVEPDHAAVLHLWPQGPDRTLLTSYTLVPEPPNDKARAYWDANNAILYGAIEEDFAMGESIQRGLASGANRDVIFGAFEHALAHFHRQIDLHTQ
ncbi:MAG: Rieske 2Fe-2S domain-containing protein [Deltaproteobacteria bacterium]|nr:Rieske 2Fe-2S domain-containing protein [Deltaproteobacteria bacterium]